jgi:uncharacterized zinc-type alcohol dehydrogenase-like protein
MTTYPVVPGHEIVGKVTGIGSGVTKHKVGDIVAVGCLVDSCRTCNNCKNDLEQYCPEWVGTYGGYDKHLDTNTHGGYSETIVVDEAFVLSVPENLDLAGLAPVLCAGITTWSPLRHWNVGKDSKVAVVGLGGLGHMAIKLANALGAHVTLFSRSPGKIDDAKALGAHDVIISTDDQQMEKALAALILFWTRYLMSTILILILQRLNQWDYCRSRLFRSARTPIGNSTNDYGTKVHGWVAHRWYCRNTGVIRFLWNT